MELEMAVVLVLGLLMGSVLGYWSVLLRVWRLEKELAQAKELDSGLVWVQKSEWESVKVRQSELEMALDLARSKLMVRE
jgi:hypothetical protein